MGGSPAEGYKFGHRSKMARESNKVLRFSVSLRVSSMEQIEVRSAQKLKDTVMKLEKDIGKMDAQHNRSLELIEEYVENYAREILMEMKEKENENKEAMQKLKNSFKISEDEIQNRLNNVEKEKKEMQKIMDSFQISEDEHQKPS